MTSLRISEQVQAALAAGRPVVALETAVITHGLPKVPWSALPPQLTDGWRADGALHVETARAMQRAVHEGDATPAVVGVVEGRLCIGLTDDELNHLAASADVRKLSTSGLADALAFGRSGGVTVSATLAACRLAEPRPIRVMATGGIGGVHAAWTRRPDISADLRELAVSPVCVVCSGAKSVLDLPATVEAMETLGVPIVGYQTTYFPRFHAGGDARLPLELLATTPAEAVGLCHMHWHTLKRTGGVLLTQAVPEPFAVSTEELDAAAREANDAVDREQTTGAARTPGLLEHLARLTGGRSLAANIALLVANARLAADIARAMSEIDA